MQPISRLVSVLVGVIATVVIFSQMAFAQDVPQSCLENTRTEAQYRTGDRFGRLIVDQAWNTINRDCNLLENFISILESSFNSLILPPNATRSVQCRHAGILNGGMRALDRLWPLCTDLCKNDGLDIGELVGKLYCDLSIALGGLEPTDDFIRGPVMWCQFLGQVFCDAAYLSFTPRYENAVGSCRPYTEDPYIETWDQFRHNGCAENPILPMQEDAEDR